MKISAYKSLINQCSSINVKPKEVNDIIKKSTLPTQQFISYKSAIKGFIILIICLPVALHLDCRECINIFEGKRVLHLEQLMQPQSQMRSSSQRSAKHFFLNVKIFKFSPFLKLVLFSSLCKVTFLHLSPQAIYQAFPSSHWSPEAFSGFTCVIFLYKTCNCTKSEFYNHQRNHFIHMCKCICESEKGFL